MDVMSVSPRDMVMWALVNASSQQVEGEYAVQHGYPPVNEFRAQAGDNMHMNFLIGAYPILWPYGVGCIEGDQGQRLGFLEHV